MFLFFVTNVMCQDLFEDGTMKLKEISTNKKYGYEPTYESAIKVGSPDSIISYLRALKGPKGEKVQFSRIGSCCSYQTKEGVELLAKWAVMYEGLKEPIILYLNKNVYESPMCPMGFSYKSVNDLEQVVLFPDDRINKVNPCKDTIYAVDDYSLKEKIGTNFSTPINNPTFIGGIEELKKYFISNPLTDERVKQLIFINKISFLVTCEGKIGNFKIVTKGEGNFKTFSNQILAIVNKMPNTWKPAIVDGKPVDCYQMLEFIVTEGHLDKVAYK